MTTDRFEKVVEDVTGMPVDVLRRTPLDELRATRERKSGQPTRYRSWFPWIGRGNVLREHLVGHEKAEQAFREAVRK